MQFNQYVSRLEMAMRLIDKDIKREERATGKSRVDIVYDKDEADLQAAYMRAPRAEQPEHARMYSGAVIERQWIKAKRPYYNIYPGIVGYLTKLNLSKVPVDALKLPLPQLLLRFPMEHNPVTVEFRGGPAKGEKRPLLTMLCGVREDEEYRALLTIFHWNLTNDFWTNSQIVSSLRLPKFNSKESQSTSVEDTIKALEGPLSDGDMAIDSYVQCIRIAATVCLLSTELEDRLVLPDVLKADEDRWEKTHDPHILERAKNNFHYGWNVGKELQISPHWRSGSPFALYYYGPRPGVPRYRPRRGTMVHRDLVKKVPTGTEEPAADENEPKEKS